LWLLIKDHATLISAAPPGIGVFHRLAPAWDESQRA
jgi:hypothetical protein